MEKAVDGHPPASYMHKLLPTRATCGSPSDQYELDWPASNYIQRRNVTKTPK
jgi:hypothetical protein